jgi:hypothetical protein
MAAWLGCRQFHSKPQCLVFGYCYHTQRQIKLEHFKQAREGIDEEIFYYHLNF